MASSGVVVPGTAASGWREAIVARERSADTRDRLADDRDRRADRREVAADQRERAADEREALADAREREADRREASVTERQQQADGRERGYADGGRERGEAPDGLEQRMAETIERSRALLALDGQRLSRQEARMKRQKARRERQQAEVSRAAVDAERRLAARLPDPSAVTERGKTLRRRVLASMRALAANEEQAARMYQELAARRPERREEYLEEAERARDSARSARENMARFSA